MALAPIEKVRERVEVARQDSDTSLFDSPASGRLADSDALSKIRPDLPIYVFSGSEDPVGQELEGIRSLIKRYRKAGVRNISHEFYEGGRHEMLNELNRGEVRKNLLAWISAVLQEEAHHDSRD